MPAPAELHSLLEQVRELQEDLSRLELEKMELEEKLKSQEALAAAHWEKVKLLTRQVERMMWNHG